MSSTVMIQARPNLLKKLLAVMAIALMLHTQAAWTCAEMSAGNAEPPPPCCAEHHDQATGRMANCQDDPSAEALCAKPYAASAYVNVLLSSGNDDDDGDLDDGNTPMLPLVAAALSGTALTYSSAGPPHHHFDPVRTLGSARLTYLNTLRLRI